MSTKQNSGTKNNPKLSNVTKTDAGWEIYIEPAMWPIRDGATIKGKLVGQQEMPEGKYGAWSCFHIKLTADAACVTGIGDAQQDYDAKAGEVVLVPAKANLSRMMRALPQDGSREVEITVTGKGGDDDKAWQFSLRSRRVST